MVEIKAVAVTEEEWEEYLELKEKATPKKVIKLKKITIWIYTSMSVL